MELETTTTIEGTTSTTSTSSSQNNSNASRLTNLDLAFILDCTASMQVYIEHAKEVSKKLNIVRLFSFS